MFQLESGFGLLRVISVDETDSGPVWHLMAYEELFPTIDAAEKATAEPSLLEIRKAHMALTDRAFDRTPAAWLANQPINSSDRQAYEDWLAHDGTVSDRSVLLMLGLR